MNNFMRTKKSMFFWVSYFLLSWSQLLQLVIFQFIRYNFSWKKISETSLVYWQIIIDKEQKMIKQQVYLNMVYFCLFLNLYKKKKKRNGANNGNRYYK